MASKESSLQGERRGAPRFDLTFKVSVAMADPESSRKVIRPATTTDVSSGGMGLRTRHELRVRQRVTVNVPTAGSPTSMAFPELFQGEAEVVRVDRSHGDRGTVGICFADSFAHDQDFTRFIDFLQTRDERSRLTN